MTPPTPPKDSIVLQTAKKHFDEDIARARAILTHAGTLPDSLLKDDLCRSAWMFGVGALDAYFSDAFGDLIARTLRAMQAESSVSVPDRFQNLKVPVATVIRTNPSDGWRWRMAARELIEEDNVLAIEKIRSLFNQFFPSTNKLFGKARIESWILDPKSNSRLFAITKSAFAALSPGNAKNTVIDQATKQLEARFEVIFQRRHDCIHNCDRPRVKPQPLNGTGTATNVISDIVFLVHHCHTALVARYPEYLKDLGFSAVTRNSVGASK